MNKTRYFRVGAFYRDENSKEIIVQCYDRKEAEGWIDRAKEMLYPGENTDEFIVTVFEFKLQINLNNLNHYRITVERPLKREFKDEWEECDYLTAQAFDALIEAENEIDSIAALEAQFKKDLAANQKMSQELQAEHPWMQSTPHPQ